MRRFHGQGTGGHAACGNDRLIEFAGEVIDVLRVGAKGQPFDGIEDDAGESVVERAFVTAFGAGVIEIGTRSADGEGPVKWKEVTDAGGITGGIGIRFFRLVRKVELRQE